MSNSLKVSFEEFAEQSEIQQDTKLFNDEPQCMLFIHVYIEQNV